MVNSPLPDYIERPWRKIIYDVIIVSEYYFVITLKDIGKVIGEIDAYSETGEQHSDENAPKDTFSPCWMLNKDYQGKGYS